MATLRDRVWSAVGLGDSDDEAAEAATLVVPTATCVWAPGAKVLNVVGLDDSDSDGKGGFAASIGAGTCQPPALVQPAAQFVAQVSGAASSSGGTDVETKQLQFRCSCLNTRKGRDCNSYALGGGIFCASCYLGSCRCACTNCRQMIPREQILAEEVMNHGQVAEHEAARKKLDEACAVNTDLAKMQAEMKVAEQEAARKKSDEACKPVASSHVIEVPAPLRTAQASGRQLVPPRSTVLVPSAALWWRQMIPNRLCANLWSCPEIWLRFPVTEPSDHSDRVSHCLNYWRRHISSSAFYWGISEDPFRRWQEHCCNYDLMMVLAVCQTSRETARIERDVIHETCSSSRCHNHGRGGERASAGSPHFVYCCSREDGLMRRPPSGGGGGAKRPRIRMGSVADDLRNMYRF